MGRPNYFDEGCQAFWAWVENHCAEDMPNCPYPEDTEEAQEWRSGVEEADDWYNHGQYEDPL